MAANVKMTVPADYDTSQISHYHIPSFQFHSGETLPITVAYRVINPSAARVVVLPTCYAGRINDTATYTAAGGALADRRVVVVAMLGNGEGSSPSNTPNFPRAIDYRDCVRAQHALLAQHLGLDHIEAVIGFSMGGQQAWYWAAMYPSFISSAIIICSSARTSVHNQVFLAGPEAALVSSTSYQAYLASGTPPVDGLAAKGRAWAAWAFSPEWYRKGFWKGGVSSLEEFLVKAVDTTFQGWDATDLLLLMSMWKRGDIGNLAKEDPDGEDARFHDVLEKIAVPVLSLPCRTDAYFTWQDAQEEVSHLKSPSRVEIIESIWGHVAGGGENEVDAKWVDGRIVAWLKERCE